MAKSHQPPVLVMEVLLEHNHAHLFKYFHGSFCVTMAELNSSTLTTCKTETMYCPIPYRKSLLTHSNSYCSNPGKR